MLRTVIIWGIIAGLIMSTPFYLFMPNAEEFDPASGMILGFSIMIIAFGTSYFGVRAYRKQVNKWSFGRAWGCALLIAFVGMIIYVGAWMIFNSNHPEFMETMFADQIESIQQDGSLTPEQQEEAISTVEWQKEVYESNIGIALITFTEPLVPAIMISLIIALILRKPEEDATLT